MEVDDAIRAEEVTKEFGAFTALRQVSLRLAPGRFLLLAGPNGAGKTTLLRTLLGLLGPLAGEVTLDGRALAAWSPRERAARLAYVPQGGESHFDFAVAEMVELGRSAHRGVFGRPGRHDREVALASLRRLGIEHLAARPYHGVSGGERQLVMIARALASEAAHVVMDEPTANLDFANQAAIIDEIARLRACGTAVLFSTHTPDHALRVADRVVMLRPGGMMAAGETSVVLASDRLTALYGHPIEVVEALCADGPRKTCIARATRFSLNLAGPDRGSPPGARP